MGYIDKNLLQNEKITYRANLHWITFLSPLSLIIIGGLCFLWAATGQNQDANNIFNLVGIIFFVVGTFSGLSALLAFFTSEFGVTSQRVLIKVGFIKRNTFELLLNKVESFQVNQSIMGRFLGYGTILVSGTGMGNESFHNIDDPLELKKNVQESVKEYELYFHKAKGSSLDSEKETISVADEIKKLLDLVDQGVLTKDEFEKQKRKLLDQ